MGEDRAEQCPTLPRLFVTHFNSYGKRPDISTKCLTAQPVRMRSLSLSAVILDAVSFLNQNVCGLPDPARIVNENISKATAELV